MPELIPKVGIGLLIVKDDEILLGKRKGSHGEGLYGGTGGHLEHGESFEACALRELAEEAGSSIKVKNLGFLCLTNFKDHLPKHYVDIGLVAEYVSGEPEVMEPDRVESWGWFNINHLPSPLFEVEVNYIEAYKTGRTYFDT